MATKKVVDAPTLKPAGAHPGMFIGGVVLAALAVALIAFLIGRADGDAIDVSQAIQNSNTAAQNAYTGDGSNAPVPVTNTYSSQPNGGLVGKGSEGTNVEPAPMPEEEIASSTDDAGNTESTEDEQEGEGEERTLEKSNDAADVQ